VNFYSNFPWKSKNEETVGVLLNEFYYYYAHFDYQNYIICPRLGHVLSRQNSIFNSKYVLVVEDPFEIDFNCARLVSSAELERIKTHFKTSFLHTHSRLFPAISVDTNNNNNSNNNSNNNNNNNNSNMNNENNNKMRTIIVPKSTGNHININNNTTNNSNSNSNNNNNIVSLVTKSLSPRRRNKTNKNNKDNIHNIHKENNKNNHFIGNTPNSPRNPPDHNNSSNNKMNGIKDTPNSQNF
jgi:hypothetical protein